MILKVPFKVNKNSEITVKTDFFELQRIIKTLDAVVELGYMPKDFAERIKTKYPTGFGRIVDLRNIAEMPKTIRVIFPFWLRRTIQFMVDIWNGAGFSRCRH